MIQSNFNSIINLSLAISDVFKNIYNSDQLISNFKTKLIKEFETIIRELGIPFQKIQMNISFFNSDNQYRFLELNINKNICYYPDELIYQLFSYTYYEKVDFSNFQSVFSIDLILNRIVDITNFNNKENLIEYLNEFLTILPIEISKIFPSYFFGELQFNEYLQLQLDINYDRYNLSDTSQKNWFYFILKNLLDQKVSIFEKEKIFNILDNRKIDRNSYINIFEDLLSNLNKKVIEIQLPRIYLTQITSSNEKVIENDQFIFTLMREGIFYELGIIPPDFKLVINNQIKNHCFLVKINHLTLPPRLGLIKNEILVNEELTRLKLLKLSGTPILNPANNIESCITKNESEKVMKKAGLTVWSDIGFFILVLSSELREHRSLLINKDVINNFLDFYPYPDLADNIEESFSYEIISWVIRCLISDGISLKNSKLIFESMINYLIRFDDIYTFVDSAKNIDEMISYIRGDLKRYITYKHAKGKNYLSVYTLDQDFEDLLSRYNIKNNSPQGDLDKSIVLPILRAIRLNLGGLVNSNTPPILTRKENRAFLKKVINLEYPRFSIISFNEIDSYLEYDIRVIDRIFLSSTYEKGNKQITSKKMKMNNDLLINFDDLFQISMESYVNKDFDKVKELQFKLINKEHLDDDQLENIYWIGYLFFMSRNYNKAKEIFSYLTQNSEISNYWRALGVVNQQLQIYSEAIKAYDQSLRIDESDIISYLYRGEAKLLDNMVDGAISDFMRVVELGVFNQDKSWGERAQLLINIYQ